MKISVVVPCYNAVTKIHECLESLNNQTLNKDLFEVIFVDDCSNDTTYEYLKNYIADKPNFNVFKLSKNSGSPSRPRNFGIKKAKGEFIFFLDADDALYSDTLEKYLELTIKNNFDLVRGYLVVDDGKERKVFNRIIDDLSSLDKSEIVSKIISLQSTTVCQLIKKSILIDNDIQWLEDIRMGEDTLFLLNVMNVANKIGYINHPTFIYNKKENGLEKSSTQTYGRRELNNHLFVWTEAEKLLKPLGLSFYKLRLKIGLKSAIEGMLKYYQHDFTEDDFSVFSLFINEAINYININSFSDKFKEIIFSIEQGDFNKFLNLIKPRLLIAGYDLKFILPAIPFLEKYYSIKIDEWTGHEIHNVEKSKELLKWADVVWCEWLLGNAVWYANNKLSHQKIVVRVHRFELTTKYIKILDYSKIDIFFTVSVYFYEKFIEKTNVERSRVRLLPNYLILEKYKKYKKPDKLFNIAMIGILPSRKGYYNSLLVLRDLVENNSKYTLHIYGKNPDELSWIANNKEQMKYYTKCSEFVKDNNLSEHVVFHGWTDIPKEIGKIGYILSVSDDEEIPESFHLAPAEAFSAGNIGLFLSWSGVEYIYPSDYIFENIGEITEYILNTSISLEIFNNKSLIGRQFVKDQYDINKFTNLVLKYLN